MCASKVVLISVAAKSGKRSHFAKLVFQRTFNFGLLSVATVASRAGFDVCVWDTSDDKFNTDDKLASALAESRASVVGLSCISGFSYPYFQVVASLVRSVLPESTIVAGGMDHVGQFPDLVLAENPAVDAVVSGYGEAPFLAILAGDPQSTLRSCIPGVTSRSAPTNRGQVIVVSSPSSDAGESIGVASSPAPFQAKALEDIPSLDYRLHEGLLLFPASVEVARGCPYSCEFCVSAGGKVVRRTPAELADEMLNAAISFGDPSIRLYLEAPLAVFGKDYLEKLKSEIAGRGISPTWRIETRVDALHPSVAEALANAGCRVIDLGLESGSPRILELMKKAKDPQGYLSKSSELLRSLSSAGIFNKINILFYAGELRSSLDETREYLELHRSSFGAIAAGPLYLYPGLRGAEHIMDIAREYGGGKVVDSKWSSRRLQPINPSAELSFEELSAISLDWEREYQSAYAYWHSRRWGYFGPGIEYENFSATVRAVGISHFPFRAETLEHPERYSGRWLS